VGPRTDADMKAVGKINAPDGNPTSVVQPIISDYTDGLIQAYCVERKQYELLVLHYVQCV